jgi:glycerate kinase
MRVLVAPDKLKGCLTATQAGEAIAAGVRLALPEAHIRLLPVADGGDGTVEASLVAGGTPVELVVPTAPDSSSSYEVTVAVLPGPPRTVVAEVAQVGGLAARRPTPAEARAASSWAAGRLVLEALVLAPERIVLGVGGTASTDGGAGALVALGARLLDGQGRVVSPGLDGLLEVSTVDLSGLDTRLVGPDPPVELVLAVDVQSPLTGPAGAARVFGPQKGLAQADVEAADAALARFSVLLREAGGADVVEWPGAGAGGGLAGGLAGALHSPPVAGTDMVFRLIGLDDAIRETELLITAEGRLDEQSLRGKAPVAVARRARELGVPCLAVAGAVEVGSEALQAEGFAAAAGLVALEPDVSRAMANAGPLLTRVTADLVSAHYAKRAGPRRTGP